MARASKKSLARVMHRPRPEQILDPWLKTAPPAPAPHSPRGATYVHPDQAEHCVHLCASAGRDRNFPDRTVQPELERLAAERMNATIYEVDSSHVPMLSNPELVLDVVRTAAREV